MQIVRPYGSTRSKDTEKGLRRVLVESTEKRREWDVPKFARSRDELIIAQWISAIDKIARKPTGNGATQEQRDFRQRLGKACWSRLVQNGHLPGAGGERAQFLEALWWFKVHPYGPGAEKPRQTGGGKKTPPPKLKGRWYEVFAGSCEPHLADIASIATRIEEHLYRRECRLGKDVLPRPRGKIEARAESIAASVFRTASRTADEKPAWSDDDKAAYQRPGDPVDSIYKEALRLEAEKRRISLPVAAKVLFEHFGKVFRVPENGGAVAAARAEHPGMLALHLQVKQYYRSVLKRTHKDTRERRDQDSKGRRLSALLPRNLDEALRLTTKQADNAALAELVRLGKIVHYTAAGGRPDRPGAIKNGWPADVVGSRLWTSEGQAEIKRAEAFVRIWRQALVLASLTLKDWVSGKVPLQGDILGGNEKKLKRALDPHLFERRHFDRKLQVLFGNRIALFPLADATACLAFLRALIEGTANLRHAVFHFKGRGQLLDEIAARPMRFPAELQQAAVELWRADAAERTARLRKTLRGAHVEEFVAVGQARRLLPLLMQEAPAELPLPRFVRVLDRAENAWGRDRSVRLPKPANRRDLEDAARLCQYTVLKLIYERAFRGWLKAVSIDKVSTWIDRAVARATEAAKMINAKDDETARQVIVGRAAHLSKPPPGSDITAFFFDLSAATAGQMRVQRGYESDPEKAREQAQYIDDLLCDVVILAFNAYLAEQKLDWLLTLRAGKTPSAQSAWSINDLPIEAAELQAADWQAALYLILHLLPVESVGRLLHQLFKWDITASRDAEPPPEEKAHLRALFATMTLYLDMHDAKFEGGTELLGCEAFAGLFAKKKGFDRVFSQVFSLETDRRIPRRGLREIVRFGHLPLLSSVGGPAKIDDAAIDRIFQLEAPGEDKTSRIAALQRRREELHALWVKQKKHLDQSELREYCEAVARISNHRQEANFVNLVDHVRAHRMILAVLGRLVDYVGLFERDLYFCTLALLNQRGLQPDSLFAEKGLKLLYNGQIIFALCNHKADAKTSEVLDQLEKYFTAVWTKGNPLTRIRNDIAHLNMLQGPAPALRLTHQINQTRRLMAYDRKLKNAVSKSVIDRMDRDGIDLAWRMNVKSNAHDLASPVLSSGAAKHLGGKSLRLAGGVETVPLQESLHSTGYVAMIAAAFEGEPQRTCSIADYLSAVDWKASSEKRQLGG